MSSQSSPQSTEVSRAPTPKTIIVIPTYNEATNLEELLDRIMAQPLGNLEVLFVDDNSPDGTADLAERLSEKYDGRVGVLRRPAKMGLGTAYIAGFTRAVEQGADYIVQMDADLSHAPEYLPHLLSRMKDLDVAVGSRWSRGGGADPEWGAARRLLSRGASLYSRLLLGLQVKDATTGFKCFHRQALEGLGLNRMRSQGFAFQVEVAYACKSNGYRVAEVPIIFKSRARGRSKMSLRIILEAFWRVLAIRTASWKR